MQSTRTKEERDLSIEANRKYFDTLYKQLQAEDDKTVFFDYIDMVDNFLTLTKKADEDNGISRSNLAELRKLTDAIDLRVETLKGYVSEKRAVDTNNTLDLLLKMAYDLSDSIVEEYIAREAQPKAAGIETKDERDEIIKGRSYEFTKAYENLRLDRHKDLVAAFDRTLNIYLRLKGNPGTTDDKLEMQANAFAKACKELDYKKFLNTPLARLIPAISDLRDCIAEDFALEKARRKKASGAQAGQSARDSTAKKPSFITPSRSKIGIGIVLAVIGVAVTILTAGTAAIAIGLAIGVGVVGFGIGWSGGHVIDTRESSSSTSRKPTAAPGGGMSGGSPYTYDSLANRSPRQNQVSGSELDADGPGAGVQEDKRQSAASTQIKAPSPSDGDVSTRKKR